MIRDEHPLEERVRTALAAREALVGPDAHAAVRLFNGFAEGPAPLALDLYGRTLVVHDHAESPAGDEVAARMAVDVARSRWPWVRAAVWKIRRGRDAVARNGRLLLGTAGELDDRVREGGVWYAVALTLNRDASLYLDTRGLRAWARENLAGKRVLNTFAYTGSLGVAARAAPAREVVHVDRNRTFLDVAKRSYALNGFALRRAEFVAADFFAAVARMKSAGELFDCAFVDPPFFSETAAGRVDLEAGADRVLNKVRPLLGDGGYLVAVNNALYVSGAEYLRMLDAMCSGGYLALEQTIPVPGDVTGPPGALTASLPADPAPFNHPTKIAVLRVKRKDGKRAGPHPPG